MTSKYSRLIAYALSIIIVALMATIRVAPRAGATGRDSATPSNSLIIHEWGTFTSIAGKDGAAVEWHPLNGPSDLPGFVYALGGNTGGGFRHGYNCTKCQVAQIRMETPVLYFYADNETTVSVRVDFPRGKVTEWYPQARTVYANNSGSGIDWGRITVLPGAQEAFPVESGAQHYYAARETDAATVRICGEEETQHEKFLFYRGVGNFDLPLTARLEGERIVVKNKGGKDLSKFILFENRDGNIGYRIHDLFGGKVAIEHPAPGQTIDELARDLESLLVAAGLYEKEAKAMIKTWRDSWFEEGTRIFYILPRKTTDAILPITIDPAPSELARVLVGRMEVVTPEMERAIQQQVARLKGSASDVKGVTAAITRKYGRFSEPVLKSILEKTRDVKLRARINQIIRTASAATY
ncbi:MAG TPA: hypothetical protein VJZ26_09225 [Blastocatellia bacterium]|nr:hypothetical protein [Blastocatellia bacterium]